MSRNISPIVWTIAGSDSGGGAGMQADLHTFHALGAHGCSVITAITAQNSLAVKKIFCVEPEAVDQQIQALDQDLPAKAIKLGMLGDAKTMSIIQKYLKQYRKGNIILDPVMVAGSGDKLFFEDAETYQKILQTFFPYIDLITPNIPEAEALTGITISDYPDMEKAAHMLISQGVKNVLIKGGHFEQKMLSQDYWTNGTEKYWLSSLRCHSREGGNPENRNIHGTGCTMSSAITALLASSYTLREAMIIAKMYVTQGIRYAEKYGQGLSPVQHLGFPCYPEDLPYLSLTPLQKMPEPFSRCEENLGIYPIVDDIKWLELLLPLGIKTIQLRLKNKTIEMLESEIKKAIKIAEQYSAQLFINDHWELALKYQAYGVHLGQEDIAVADMKKIRQAGLRLGLSTHSYEELAMAHALNPSYIAFGPIFPTMTKQMSFAPQGIEMLKKVRSLVACPLVAIGGINQANIADVVRTGVNGVAMISAITQAEDTVGVVKGFKGLL